jgi:hypothetical protein
MSEVVQFNDHEVYYDYDDFQDMLYITFSPAVGATYYSDVEELEGVMLRYDGESERLIGVTVHNVKHKLQRWLVEDLCRRFIPSERERVMAQPPPIAGGCLR